VPTVHKRAIAKRDLVEPYVYRPSMPTMRPRNGFLANAGESFTDLSRNPGMGAPLSRRSPKLAGLRKSRVSGFEKFLIFYPPSPDGVSIVRVLHAAQDWWTLLGIL